jgi:hypothetical protein
MPAWSSITACPTLVPAAACSPSLVSTKFFALWHSSNATTPSKSGPHHSFNLSGLHPQPMNHCLLTLSASACSPSLPLPAVPLYYCSLSLIHTRNKTTVAAYRWSRRERESRPQKQAEKVDRAERARTVLFSIVCPLNLAMIVCCM